MKTIHECSRCGKQFTDDNSWSKAWECESSHQMPSPWSKYNSDLSEMSSWKVGQVFPESVILDFETYDEKGESIHQFMKYSLPKDVTDSAQIQTMLEKYKPVAEDKTDE